MSGFAGLCVFHFSCFLSCLRFVCFLFSPEVCLGLLAHAYRVPLFVLPFVFSFCLFPFLSCGMAGFAGLCVFHFSFFLSFSRLVCFPFSPEGCLVLLACACRGPLSVLPFVSSFCFFCLSLLRHVWLAGSCVLRTRVFNVWCFVSFLRFVNSPFLSCGVSGLLALQNPIFVLHFFSSLAYSPFSRAVCLVCWLAYVFRFFVLKYTETGYEKGAFFGKKQNENEASVN